MAILTDDNVVDFFATDPLPSGTLPGDDWKIYFGDPTAQHVWLGTLADLRRALAAGATLPKPAPNAFADFQDTQAGGSVRIVPTTGYAAADYKYRIGSSGPYLDAPIDGVVAVGNVTAAVYAYLPATPTRQQSDTAVSASFTEYTPSTPANVTPEKPTFTNFNDTANTVVLVPAPGVPLSDYRYKIGGSGPEQVAPNDGILNVGDVTAQVFAYSVAATGLNQSLTAASPQFTATPAPPPSFNTTIDSGQSVNSISFTGATGQEKFLFNLPLSSNTDPYPSAMEIFAQDGTQVGHVDFSGWDMGAQVGFKLTATGQLYLLTLTSSNVTLS